MFPSLQTMLTMLSGYKSWGEVGHLVIRACTRMSNIFIRPRKLYPHGHLREFAAIISISQRGVHVTEESRWQTGLKMPRLNHTCSKDLLLYPPQVQVHYGLLRLWLNSTHQKQLCFLLNGFCNAVHPSSHKGSPHCQAYFYGSSPKQVQNSAGVRWTLPPSGHWSTICKLSGNSKHCRLSNSLLIFSLGSETF